MPLPDVGFRAVILGMAPFEANFNTVNAYLNKLAQTAYYLERATDRAFSGTEKSYAGLARAAEKATTRIQDVEQQQAQKVATSQDALARVIESTSAKIAQVELQTATKIAAAQDAAAAAREKFAAQGEASYNLIVLAEGKYAAAAEKAAARFAAAQVSATASVEAESAKQQAILTRVENNLQKSVARASNVESESWLIREKAEANFTNTFEQEGAKVDAARQQQVSKTAAANITVASLEKARERAVQNATRVDEDALRRQERARQNLDIAVTRSAKLQASLAEIEGAKTAALAEGDAVAYDNASRAAEKMAVRITRANLTVEDAVVKTRRATEDGFARVSRAEEAVTVATDKATAARVSAAGIQFDTASAVAAAEVEADSSIAAAQARLSAAYEHNSNSYMALARAEAEAATLRETAETKADAAIVASREAADAKVAAAHTASKAEMAAADAAAAAAVGAADAAEAAAEAAASEAATVATNIEEQQYVHLAQVHEATSAAIIAAEERVALATSQASMVVTEAYAAATAAAEAHAAAVGTALDKVARIASSVGQAVAKGLAIGVGALAALAVAAEIVGAKYAANMAFIGAISQDSARDLAALDDQQIELSRHSTQSAIDLSKASEELVKAGFAARDVTGEVLQAVNDLVVASKGELQAADAASLAQVAHAAFGASVTEAADAATAAVQKSTLSFTDFADALKQGGAVAAKQGLNIQEFAAAVGVMGLQIKSGAEVGTNLRTMFQRLENPSAENIDLMKKYGISLYDAKGAARPFFDVLSSLETQFSDTAVAQGKLTAADRDNALASIFGTRVQRGVVVLIDEGTDAYLNMLEATRQLKAADIASKVLSPTSAVLKELENNAQDAGIAFSKGLDPYVNTLAKDLLSWAQTVPLKEIKDLGKIVGEDLYLGLRSVANITKDVLLPVLNTLFHVMLPITAVLGIRLAVAAIVAMNASLDLWIAKMAVALGWNLALTASIATQWVRAAAGAATAIGVMIGQLALLTAGWIVDVGLINSATGSMVASFLIGVGAIIGAEGIAAMLTGIGAIAIAMGLLVVAWQQNWFDIQNVAKKSTDNLATILLGSSLGKNPIIVALVDKMMNNVVPAVTTAVTGAADAVSGYIKDTIGAFQSLGGMQEQLKKDQAKAQADLAELERKRKEAEDEAGKANDKLRAPAVDTEAGSFGDGADAAKKYADFLKKLRDLQKDFAKDSDQEAQAITKGLVTAYSSAYDDINNETVKFAQEIADATSDALNKLADLDRSRAIQQGTQERRDALEQLISDTNDANQKILDANEVVHQRDLEDLQASLDKQREIRDRAFDEILQKEDEVRQRHREDEDHSYQLDLDARKKLFDDGLQQLEDNLQNEQDARQKALDTQLESEKAALAKSQKQREDALQATLDAEKRVFQHDEAVAGINQKDSDARAKAQAEYNAEIARGVKQSIAQARLDDKLKKIAEDTADAKAGLASDEAKQNLQDQFDAGQQAKKDALQAIFDQENLAQEADFQKRKADLQDTFDTETNNLKIENAKKQLEEEEKLYQESLARSRTREDEDLVYRAQQEQKKRENDAKEDAAALEAKRKQDDEERTRKAGLDAAAAAQRKMDDAARRALEKQLDNEDYLRKKGDLDVEKADRIANAEETLATEQEKTRTKLAQDILDLRDNLADRVKTIKEQYTDKLAALLDESGQVVNPLVDSITDNISTGLQGIRDDAQAATDKLAEMFSAAQNLSAVIEAANNARNAVGGGGSADHWFDDYNFGIGSGMAEADARAYADARNPMHGHQYGGVVDAPYGQPVPVIAHGGERFEGIGGYNTAMTAVRMRESMAASGIGVGGQVSNTWSYNVNANYGQTQPAGSVARDLRALVALTRR